MSFAKSLKRLWRKRHTCRLLIMLVTPTYKKKVISKTQETIEQLLPYCLYLGKNLTELPWKKSEKKSEPFTSEAQFGFRPKRGTVDAIFITRQLMQKAKERGVRLNCHFIDFKSAFNHSMEKRIAEDVTCHQS